MTLAQQLFEALLSKHLVLATAESCTGGMVAAAVTDIAGSSAVFDRGFVTYSNAAKHQMLGVPIEMIDTFGAVSTEVAVAMAAGAVRNSLADVAVAITGVAGPTGGSIEKPIGLVHFAVATKIGSPSSSLKHFGPLSRAEIRALSTQHALSMLLDQLETVS